MEYYMGLDIGSTASKCVIADETGDFVGFGLAASGAGTDGPQKCLQDAVAQAGITQSQIRATCATGYGRKLLQFVDLEMSELTCHAKGASALFPRAKTIIDIGGQDAKVLRVDDGALRRFVMNDKCAAGTGRFLDVMASIVGHSVDELSDLDFKSENPVSISSTCTVFAESEVISKLAQGATIPDVVAGVHCSVVEKTCGLVKRLGVVSEIAMTGGVALNRALVKRLEACLGEPIHTDSRSQFNGAIGAALVALEKRA